jgi:hypothetical protein
MSPPQQRLAFNKSLVLLLKPLSEVAYQPSRLGGLKIGKRGQAGMALGVWVGLSGLFWYPAVGAASSIFTGALLRKGKYPVCYCPAGGAVFLDWVLLPRFRQIGFVD